MNSNELNPLSASLHLAPDRYPRQHPTTPFFTGRLPFLPPNQQRQSTEGTSTEGTKRHLGWFNLCICRVSVCLSVCPIIHPLHTAAAGLLLSAVPAARDIDRRRRPAAAAAADAGSVTLTADSTWAGRRQLQPGR